MTKAELRAECTELFEWADDLDDSLNELLNVVAHHVPMTTLVAILNEWRLLGNADE